MIAVATPPSTILTGPVDLAVRVFIPVKAQAPAAPHPAANATTQCEGMKKTWTSPTL